MFLQRFEHLKQDVFRVEKSMLRAFGFVTHVEHPHKFVLSLLQILDIQSLEQDAWNLTNDRCDPQDPQAMPLRLVCMLVSSKHIVWLCQRTAGRVDTTAKAKQCTVAVLR